MTFCLLSSLASTPLALGIGYVVTAQSRAAADALSQQAYAAYQGGDYARAVALTEQADRLNPDQPDSWNLRGMALLKQKDTVRAQAAFARATALDPKLWAARFNSAEACFQQKAYAEARTRFDRLLAQTDRYKEGNKWELVEYKTIICCLLTGDLAGANRKLAKLPAGGGATPGRLYAQAAFAYQAKNPALAQKSLLAAQGAFPAEMNELFSAALVQVGWQTPPPAPPPLLAAGSFAPPSGAQARTHDSTGYIPYPVDPKLEALSDPLPVPDAGRSQPVLSRIPLPLLGPSNPVASGAPPLASTPLPGPALAASAPVPAPTPALPDIGLEHGGLLLDE